MREHTEYKGHRHGNNYWLFRSGQKFVISVLWGGEPELCFLHAHNKKSEGCRKPSNHWFLWLLPHCTTWYMPRYWMWFRRRGCSKSQSVPKVVLKNHWFVRGCLWFWEQGLIQVSALLPLLLMLKHSSVQCCSKCTLSCWVPKLWTWTQSNSEYSKHENKLLGCQAIYGPLPIAAAELPESNFLPEAPLSPSKNHPARFCRPVAVRWKGQSDSSSLKKHQMEGESAYKQSSCD